MRKFLVFGVTLCGATLAANVVLAQQGGGSFVGRTTASPGCRAVEMHIIRENAALSGVVFYRDGSGVSSVSGTSDAGQINFQMMPTGSGKGPEGPVAGTISPEGVLKLSAKGGQCTFQTTLSRMPEVAAGGG